MNYGISLVNTFTSGDDKAMQANGIPEKVTMDKSGANKAAIDQINESMEVPMFIQQVKYLNNIIEQDHRAVKIITKPMLGFKSFKAAKSVLAGIELMHMIRCLVAQERCLLPTSFMLWQDKSVQCEKEYKPCQNFDLQFLTRHNRDSCHDGAYWRQIYVTTGLQLV